MGCELGRFEQIGWGIMTSVLISILNSGESLEKTLTLSRLAYQQNSEFYNDIDDLIVFYTDNLPKKIPTIPAHGTIGALLTYLPSAIPYKNFDDIWDDRQFVLSKLKTKERITERMRFRLFNERERYLRTIACCPWYDIFDNMAYRLIRELNSALPVICIQRLDFRNNFERTIGHILNYFPIAKLYFLNPDGIMSSRAFGRSILGLHSTLKDSVERCIVCSPNVYTFLTGIIEWIETSCRSVLVGFRHFNRTPRRSYDTAIDAFDMSGLKMIIEPANKSFTKVLDSIDIKYGCIPLEHKINLSIYQCLREVL